ncbi:ROK family protein [Cohaesibacter celericrescens]|uniref:N-acetylglucosamine kinase n=1 Tax=Cohaesibacter celericrescens TaxID=2067669 RepID=A0A2N5XSP1_9HYPH|nr:ROK family protein [Cohaesibacter celericrescens]PLW77541.1 N-acetylglucosamine kinase [Cohaesibacter celericrescens]
MHVCFDIGGTSIKGALVNSPEDIELVPRIATPGHDLDAFTAALDSVVKQARETPKCVSISITGIINPATGLAVVANIPCLHGRPMQQDLEEALGLPVIITNDADCFTLAEAELGVAKGHDIVFGVILGTGVGGGIVVNGQLLNRHGGYAGEWGHGPVAATQAGSPPVDLPRIQCGCGLKGCIDATCSARGMEKLHKHLHGETSQAEDIMIRWLAGEVASSRTIDVYVDLIASPLALVANATGASIVPVGGGLSNVPMLIAEIDRVVKERMLLPPENPFVVPAENKIEPGIIGAAVLGHRAFP